MRRTRSDRLANGLTLLVVAATGVLAFLYVAIALNPAVVFNPYPPPSAAPPLWPPTPTSPPIAAASTSAPRAFPSPTPLRPATLTPTPEPGRPFSATVQPGPYPPLLDCTSAGIVGSVTDWQGEPLVGYPVHVWGPGVQSIALSGSAPGYGPSGWQVAVSVDEEGATWFAQLHLYDVHQVHPPLSNPVSFVLPETCPQVLVFFHEQR